jgi:transcriptional regulator with XRE-family HTH domain
MPSRYRRRDVGKQHSDRLTKSLGDEVRSARLGLGLSQRVLARACGLSASQMSRLERGRSPEVPLRTLAVVFAVLGMRLSARPYPEGVPLRDAAHAALLARFRAELPPEITMRTEVPLGIDRDLRAWDAVLETTDDTCRLEAETALYDLQAQERRIALKMADAGVERVILLVADTHRNRRVLREYRGLVSARFPLDSRAVMSALRAGSLPGRSGVVIR